MDEKIIKISIGTGNKKYKALIKQKDGKTRTIQFGSKTNEQYKDSTPLKLYSKKDHNDKKRRQNYFNRFSGTKTKKEALEKEIKKSNGKYTAKILAFKLLW